MRADDQGALDAVALIQGTVADTEQEAFASLVHVRLTDPVDLVPLLIGPHDEDRPEAGVDAAQSVAPSSANRARLRSEASAA